MKILFITDNFPPEVNAPANRGYDHAVEWVKMGYKITVITCHPNFPKGQIFDGYKNSLFSVEHKNGIRIIRVWSYISANEGFFKRSLDYFSFSVSSFIAGLFIKTDLILATSPQFFTAFSGKALSFFKRKPWVLEIRDLWPDSIVAVGSLTANSRVYRILKTLESYFYKTANRVIVVTDSFKKYLVEKHEINESKIGVFKNGVANNSLEKYDNDDISILKESLGIASENKIISYIGTHGLAHGLDFILYCAKKIEGKPYHFLFIGDGAKKEELLTLRDTLELSNITFINTIPKKEVSQHIHLSDYALVNLKKSDEFKNVIPSKIFENIAARKPILLGVEGESQEIIESYGVGISFEPENETQFLETLEKIESLPNSDDFENGCVRLLNDFNRIKIAQEMGKFMSKCILN
ncbi:MAG: glycosyltransferase family 4 protein [Flavobacteriaceae bacterium]|nr:glycosyltransferase family 4 protein [Flavobacteriaceae bacterium]